MLPKAHKEPFRARALQILLVEVLEGEVKSLCGEVTEDIGPVSSPK